jgi:CRP/FNR family cyclic AMP-dependent transcriptional regulator
MTTSMTVDEVFAALPLFARLSARQRSRLVRLATTRSYRPGDVILREGDTSMSLYVILSGAVEIYRQADGGQEVFLAKLGPADVFGEMGLIDDVVRSATITASEPTECALLTRWDFRRELSADPDIALALLPVLTERIRNLEARLAKMESRDQGPST